MSEQRTTGVQPGFAAHPRVKQGYFDDETRDKIEQRAADPNSDWPEPKIDRQYVQEHLQDWVGTASAEVKKGANVGEAAITPPVAGRSGDPQQEGGDAVRGVNQAVGEGLTGLTPHHGKKTANRMGPGDPQLG